MQLGGRIYDLRKFRTYEMRTVVERGEMFVVCTSAPYKWCQIRPNLFAVVQLTNKLSPESRSR